MNIKPITIAAFISLTACGGGGGSNTSTACKTSPTRAPTVAPTPTPTQRPLAPGEFRTAPAEPTVAVFKCQ